MNEQQPTLAPHSKWLRNLLRLALIAATIYALHLLIGWATAKLEASGNMPLMIGLIAALLIVYALLMALPFAPGIEIGVSLLLLRGAEVAPFVYAATVAGLSLAFLVGRYIPYAWLQATFDDLGLVRAGQLLARVAPLDREARLAVLAERVPRVAHPIVGRGRYLLLAGLLNLPGNVLLGGGGGLAFIAGLSRLYGTTATLAVMALGVLPVPLWVWLYGTGFLQGG